MRDEVVFYQEACLRERRGSLQQGMHYRSNPKYSVVVMSRRPNAPYEVLLEHENEHVSRDRALVEEYAGRIKAALRTADLPSAQAPLRGPEAARGMERSEAAVRELIRPLQEELEEKRRQASQALDAPEVYAAMQERCAGQ